MIRKPMREILYQLNIMALLKDRKGIGKRISLDEYEDHRLSQSFPQIAISSYEHLLPVGPRRRCRNGQVADFEKSWHEPT